MRAPQNTSSPRQFFCVHQCAALLLVISPFQDPYAFAQSGAGIVNNTISQSVNRLGQDIFATTSQQLENCRVRPTASCTMPYLFIPNKTLNSAKVSVIPLIEYNVRNYFSRNPIAYNDLDSLQRETFRLAWIQAELFKPFLTPVGDIEKEIDGDQVAALSQFIANLSESLYTKRASDEEVLLAQSKISLILEADLRRRLSLASPNTGGYAYDVTKALLLSIQKALCPLWPICN